MKETAAVITGHCAEPYKKDVLTVKPSVLSILLHQYLAVGSAAVGFQHIKQTKSLISDWSYFAFCG